MRVVSRITPAPLVWSLMASTCAVCGNTSRTLPTMPSGVITAMSRSMPVVLALVDIEHARLVGSAGADGLRRDASCRCISAENSAAPAVAGPGARLQAARPAPAAIGRPSSADPRSAGARGADRCSCSRASDTPEPGECKRPLRRGDQRIGPERISRTPTVHRRESLPACPSLERRTCMARPMICATSKASSTSRFR